MTQEFQRVVDAARPIADLEPSNAWELDEQLAASANIWPALAEIFATYAENLDGVKLDPRVTASYLSALEHLGEAHRQFAATRQLWRRLYEKALEQAESDVRDVERPGFWSQASV